MKNNITWHRHPQSIPTQGVSYLIHLKTLAAINQRLGGLPPIVIAKFIDGEWSLNGATIPATLPMKDVLGWHPIPNYEDEKN